MNRAIELGDRLDRLLIDRLDNVSLRLHEPVTGLAVYLGA